ncbi:MAG: hypothetical protein OEW45_05720, partial [Deltaproteobacteria bacterium]|nr:hypothetical protein [Deltaproteobacteria bacterium]
GRPFASVEGGGVFLPALSSEKSPPHGAKQIALASGPWQSHMRKLGDGKGWDLTADHFWISFAVARTEKAGSMEDKMGMEW